MTKQEFINKAKEYRYTDKEIQVLLKDVEDAKKNGIKMPYETISLVQVN